MTRKEIGNSMYLTCVPSEKFKTGFLSAQLVVPLARETAGLGALLVNVLSRGTARCPDMAALGRELDMLYGARLEPSVRKKGENQLLGFVASGVDDKYLPAGERLLERLTDLLGEILLAPALQDGHLNEAYVSGERENLADLIRSTINDKRAYAARRLLETMCADEPYGVSRLGTAEDVEAVTMERLDTFYRDLLPKARLELFYCGGLDPERVTGAFRQAFGAMPRGVPLEPAPTTRRNAPEEPRTVTEELDVTQGKLCIGCRTESGDVPGSMLMNTMLGGGTTSKLFVTVREKLSLCYYADSVYHRQKGLVTISSGIRFEDYERAVETILAQLEDLKKGVWEDWELEAARRHLCSAIRTMEDSAGSLEDYHMGQAAAGGGETLEELREGLLSVTKDRVMEAAKAVRPDTIYFLRNREGRV